MRHEVGQHEVTERPEMRVHDVERHLHGIEAEPALGRDLEHLEVDARVLVAREADVAQLAGLLGLDERFHGAALSEDAVRVVVAEDLVMLDEVDVVGAHPLERRVDLLGGLFLGAPVHLGHEEHLVAIASLLERHPHPELAAALVVVPAIVHEGDAAIDGLVNQPHGVLVGQHPFADMEAAHPDGGDPLARSAQGPVEHFAAHLSRIGDEGEVGRVGGLVHVAGQRRRQSGGGHGRSRAAGRDGARGERGRLQEASAFHGALLRCSGRTRLPRRSRGSTRHHAPGSRRPAEIGREPLRAVWNPPAIGAPPGPAPR